MPTLSSPLPIVRNGYFFQPTGVFRYSHSLFQPIGASRRTRSYLGQSALPGARASTGASFASRQPPEPYRPRLPSTRSISSCLLWIPHLVYTWRTWVLIVFSLTQTFSAM